MLDRGVERFYDFILTESSNGGNGVSDDPRHALGDHATNDHSTLQEADILIVSIHHIKRVLLVVAPDHDSIISCNTQFPFYRGVSADNASFLVSN